MTPILLRREMTLLALSGQMTAQGFVAYWGKSEHREALALSGVGRE